MNVDCLKLKKEILERTFRQGSKAYLYAVIESYQKGDKLTEPNKPFIVIR